MANTIQVPSELPKTGLLRLNQFLPFVGLGRSTVWLRVSQGRFPQPLKIGPKTTAWKVADIHQFIENPMAFENGGAADGE